MRHNCGILFRTVYQECSKRAGDMQDKIVYVLIMTVFTASFAYLTWCGYRDKCLGCKGEMFSRREKPFFYWALMFMSAFMTFAGSAGLVVALSKLL